MENIRDENTPRPGDNRLAGMSPRRAGPSDLEGIATTLTGAFEADPLWSWAFPDPRGLGEWWRLLVGSALRRGEVWTLDDHAAAAVWIPPGGTELTEAEEAQVEPLLKRLIGSRSAEVLELLDRFEATHPEGPPHYYLSLLGTHPDHRGKGLGMGLLAHNLELIDAEGMPAYLESSNPANDARYESLGFSRAGQFTRPDEGLAVSTMWRGGR
jgi:GNAT superfamily N-acetyltransferase